MTQTPGPITDAYFVREHPGDIRDAFADLAQAQAGFVPKKMHPSARRMLNMGHRLTDVAATMGNEIAKARGMGEQPVNRAVDVAIQSEEFADTLADGVGRIVSQAYQGSQDHLALVSRIPAGDYQPLTMPQLDINDSLDFTPELASPQMTSISTTSGEEAQVESYGRLIAVTRRVLLSDTDGNLQVLARRLGDAAARNEARLVYDIIEGNPQLQDGSNLWSGDSLITGAGGLSSSSLADGMAQLRNQTTIGGHRGNFKPAILLVAPEEEWKARQLVKEVSVGDEPILDVVVSPWLSGDGFYLFTDPSAAPVIGLLTLSLDDDSVTIRRDFDSQNRRQIIGVWQDVNATPISRLGAVKVAD